LKKEQLLGRSVIVNNIVGGLISPLLYKLEIQ